MALRVLLADESSTIKKVMQLALQDFAVEVKAVPIGLDVLQVARSFQPDLVFADVLLSKKTGYDVCAELKADPQLKKTPVVLMWSGFMEIDEAKARASGCDRRLEKPFDADHLRQIVKDLVPKLGKNEISDYLTFPDLPEIVETPMPAAPAPAPVSQAPAPRASSEPPPPPPPPRAKAQAPAASAPTSQGAKGLPQAPAAPPARPQAPIPAPAPSKNDLSFSGFAANEDLEDPDDFQQIPLPGSRPKDSFGRREDEDWRQGGLEQFRVTPPTGDGLDGWVDVSDASLASTDGANDLPLDELEDLTSRKQAPAPAPHSRTFTPERESAAETPVSASASIAQLDPMRAEEVLREQVREVLENIAWKIIPDITERIVREEIQKLLKEAERLS